MAYEIVMDSGNTIYSHDIVCDAAPSDRKYESRVVTLNLAPEAEHPSVLLDYIKDACRVCGYDFSEEAFLKKMARVGQDVLSEGGDGFTSPLVLFKESGIQATLSLTPSNRHILLGSGVTVTIAPIEGETRDSNIEQRIRNVGSLIAEAWKRTLDRHVARHPHDLSSYHPIEHRLQ